MKALVQRVLSCRVEVDGKTVGAIGSGIVIFLGIKKGDSPLEVDWLSQKVLSMRLFPDENGKMAFSIQEKAGREILVVSQFTLYCECGQGKGRRPDCTEAMRGEEAYPLYTEFLRSLHQKSGVFPQSGVFGAYMKIDMVHDGPFSVVVETPPLSSKVSSGSDIKNPI